jgi:hypothetical protein
MLIASCTYSQVQQTVNTLNRPVFCRGNTFGLFRCTTGSYTHGFLFATLDTHRHIHNRHHHNRRLRLHFCVPDCAAGRASRLVLTGGLSDGGDLFLTAVTFLVVAIISAIIGRVWRASYKTEHRHEHGHEHEHNHEDEHLD